MTDLILHLLLLGVVIYFMAEALPGIYVAGYGTALIVAIVYGLINITLGTVLKLLSIPFIIISVGIFLLVINAFLLYLTDLLVDDFEIEDTGTTIVAALIITISDTMLAWIF
jgi:putative membrane protein